MDQEIKILMLEDTPLDVELIEREFKKEGVTFQLKRVETKEAFEQALVDFAPNIILSDLQLPAFDGLTALAIVKEKFPQIPFIIVSGKIGEDVAVDAVKKGAADYVFKHHLVKIVPAALRALKEFNHNAQLMESQRMSNFLAAVVETSSDAIIGLKLDGTILSWNIGARQIFGYSPDEIMGNNISLLLPSGYPNEFHNIKGVIQKDEHISQYQTKRKSKDGHVLDITETISPVKNHQGEIIGISKIIRDITKLVNTQKELDQQNKNLIESDERLRQLTENIKEVVWLVTQDWSKILYINSAYTEVFGRSRGELYANPLSFIESIHVEDRPRVLSAIEEQKVNAKYEVEYRVVQPNGNIRWVTARALPIKNSEGKIYRMAGILEDITRHKEAETALKLVQRQLIHTEKLAAIGQLSAGVAHEIKNPLGIITLSIEQLKGEIKDLDEEKKVYIEMIQEATERANRVVVELLNYSRTSELTLAPLTIEKSLDQTVFLLKNALKGKNIAIRCQYSKEETFMTLGDKSLLEQVFFNLIANAIDAIEKEGNIDINTYMDHSNGKNKNVIIEIADTGSGMSPEVARNIFAPFYTTKPQGKGTGLGLSIVDTILSQHHGTIRVESKEGLGTKFFVALPLLEGN